MTSMYSNPIKKNGDFADPFVLRFNGRYYLYCTNPGVKCWSSANLIDWQEEGAVVPEDEFPGLVPFAPEVVYENGSFYMYTSPHGFGHYVLKSQSPIGPFHRITPNVGHSIDLSVFLDEDGRRYAFWADERGIAGCEMPSPVTFGEPQLVGAYLHGWTEGPYVVKRGGVYHLTYTGNHYLSKGYRIHGAISSKPLGPYEDNPNNPLLVRTEGPVVGLGHSSTVLGPDLTSHYLFYHNLNPDKTRDLNIARVLLSSEGANILGPTIVPQEMPAMPAYAASTLAEKDWRVLKGTWKVECQEGVGAFEARLEKSLPASGVIECHLCTVGRQMKKWGIRLGDVEKQLELIVDSEKQTALVRQNEKSIACVSLGTDFVSDAMHLFRLEWNDYLILHVDHMLITSLPWEMTNERFSCFSFDGMRIGHLAIADAGSPISFPLPCRLPDRRSWQQQIHEAGEYALLVTSNTLEANGLIVDGFAANASCAKGVHYARWNMTLCQGKHDIHLKNALGHTMYEKPEGIEFHVTMKNIGPDEKSCVGGPWDDGVLKANITLGERQVGWEAGILLRASELAEGGEGNDSVLGANFFIGYRICISDGKLSLWKHRYDAQLLDETAFCAYESVKIRVRMEVDCIEVICCEKRVLFHVDKQPIPVGYAGIQARGCIIREANLQMQSL